MSSPTSNFQLVIFSLFTHDSFAWQWVVWSWGRCERYPDDLNTQSGVTETGDKAQCCVRRRWLTSSLVTWSLYNLPLQFPLFAELSEEPVMRVNNTVIKSVFTWPDGKIRLSFTDFVYNKENNFIIKRFNLKQFISVWYLQYWSADCWLRPRTNQSKEWTQWSSRDEIKSELWFRIMPL